MHADASAAPYSAALSRKHVPAFQYLCVATSYVPASNWQCSCFVKRVLLLTRPYTSAAASSSTSTSITS